MILTDTFIVENAELITEQRGGKSTRILRGIFGRCDEKNNNGRVYSKPLLEREVNRIADAMTERRLMGELDHPSHDAVKLSNVSHLITNLSFKGNELVGECELLDTPSGKVAQALVEGGVKVGISSRGMGTLSEQADGTKTVNEDFKLVTFDLVADPSTRGAFPGISESTQSSLVEEIVKDTLDKAAKEKIFTTMLKTKIREKTEKLGTFDMNQAPPKLLTIPELQKKAEKNTKPGSDDDPLKDYEDFYHYNSGKPRKKTTRGYDNAETVTSNPEVSENKYAQLKGLLESNTSINEFSVLSNILTESKKKGLTKSQAKLIAQAGGIHTKKSKRLGVHAGGGKKRGREAQKEVEELARRTRAVERAATSTGAPLAGRGRGHKFRSEDDPEYKKGSGARIRVTRHMPFGRTSKDKQLPRQGNR